MLLPVSPLLQISATGRRFRASAKVVPFTRMGLFLPRASHARVREPIVPELYTLNIPLNEPLECRIAGRYQAVAPGFAYVAGPGSEVDLRTGHDTGTLALNVSADLIGAHWLGPEGSSVSGEPRVLSLATPSGRSLFRALSTAWGDALRSSIAEETARELEDEIIAALVQFLAPDDDALDARESTQTLERAKEYIRAHLGDRLVIPDIAWAAGTSNRSLYRLFTEEEGLTPMQFATRERLNAARRVLFAANPEDTTVTQVALAHGFAHLGRFSLLYAQAFGERPSTTLRR